MFYSSFFSIMRLDVPLPFASSCPIIPSLAYYPTSRIFVLQLDHYPLLLLLLAITNMLYNCIVFTSLSVQPLLVHLLQHLLFHPQFLRTTLLILKLSIDVLYLFALGNSHHCLCFLRPIIYHLLPHHDHVAVGLLLLPM